MTHRKIINCICSLVIIILLSISVSSFATTVNTQNSGNSTAKSDIFTLTDENGHNLSTNSHYEVLDFWVDTNGKANIIWKGDKQAYSNHLPNDVTIAGQNCGTIYQYTNFSLTDSSGNIKNYTGGNQYHYFIATLNLTEEFATTFEINIETGAGGFNLTATALVKVLILVQHDVNGTISTDWEQTKGTADIGSSYSILKKDFGENVYKNVTITDPNGSTTNSTDTTISVTAQEGTTKVLFHYGPDDTPITNISNSTITKTGTNDIFSYDQVVNYSINYHTEITTNSTDELNLTIIDTLPSTINLDQSYNFDGGVYNYTDKTITWTGRINPTANTITWTDNSIETIDLSNISIIKNLSFIYGDILNKNGQQIINIVDATISNNVGEILDTIQDDHPSNIDYNITIVITKEWVGDDESNRPQSINVMINGNEDEIIVIDKEHDNWTKTLYGYPKYTGSDMLLNSYDIYEFETEGYKSNIEKNQVGNIIYFTITNTKKSKELVLPATGGNKLIVSMIGISCLIMSLYLFNINNKMKGENSK